MYNHSRVCYFGLAKPVWSWGTLQGDRQKVSGTIRNGTGCPSLCPQPSLPGHPDRPEAQHLWQVGILVLSCSENKNNCSSFLWRGGGCQREPPPFPQRGCSGEESGIGPVPRFRAPSGHTLGLSSGSGLHVQGRRNCISMISTVKGWLLSREFCRGPGYMASGPGGSLKSLAADTSLLMCLSSVMPAS